MKKVFALIIILILCLFATICSAADNNAPIINAKNKKFNVFTATYILDGNVYIQHKTRSVTADYAEYSLMTQQVKARGNIVFNDGDFSASCQSLVAYINEENVDLIDNVTFKQHKLKITAQTANFNWQSKISIFKGDVKINNNGKRNNSRLAIYNVLTNDLKF